MEKMYRVLLANGSEEFCGKLGVALKQTNRYSVVGSACDGVRAISLLKELKPDLLVVDLMLPQADGLSVLKAAAGLDPKPKLLVLVEFVTEYVSSMFMTLGVQYIMLKPCSCRAVVERLDEICESAVSRKPAIAAKRNANIESMVTSIIHEIGVPAPVREYRDVARAQRPPVPAAEKVNRAVQTRSDVLGHPFGFGLRHIGDGVTGKAAVVEHERHHGHGESSAVAYAH